MKCKVHLMCLSGQLNTNTVYFFALHNFCTSNMELHKPYSIFSATRQRKTYVCFKNTYFKSFLLYGKHPKTVFSILRKNPNEIPLSSLTCNLVNYFFSADLQEHLKQRSSVYRNLADFLIVYF